MAITVGNLRLFCQEIASPDSSGETADREFMRWINAALMRCYTELHWDRIQFEKKLTVLPEVDGGATLNLTQGSGAIVLSSGTLDQNYVDERYELHVDGESRFSFELASIDDAPTNQNGTLIDGDEWIGTTQTGVQHYWVKTRYTVPDNAQRVSRVQILQTGMEVEILQPAEFDAVRSNNTTQRGAYPRFAAFRRGRLEIWPHPGSDYLKLGVTYIKGPTVVADAADDADEIDWDESWRDLIEKAIMLEAAITQADNSPVPYQIALAEWERRKATYQRISQKPDLTGPLNVRSPIEERRIGDRTITWLGPLEDV